MQNIKFLKKYETDLIIVASSMVFNNFWSYILFLIIIIYSRTAVYAEIFYCIFFNQSKKLKNLKGKVCSLDIQSPI